MRPLLDPPGKPDLAASLDAFDVHLDVTDKASFENMARVKLRRFGRMDVLVTNAPRFDTFLVVDPTSGVDRVESN